MTEKRWSFNGGVIVGTDICEEGIPHTNRSIVTHLNMYERKIRELEKENKKLIKMLDNVANYMQKEHKEIPLDDFVEWWNNIATKGISNGDIND